MKEDCDGASLRKGICIPLGDDGSLQADGENAQDGRGTSRPWLLIPSWTERGVFRGENRGGGSSSRTKRKRRRDRDDSDVVVEGGDDRTDLERLASCELRRCDVCARDVLWTPASEGLHFPARESSSPDAGSSPPKSIAESLPRFVENHVSCAAPVPCSFCTAAKSGSKGWCGSLYCSSECRFHGEKATKSDARSESSDADAQFPALPAPKLFFCRNRFTEPRDLSAHKERSELIEEIAESMLAIEKRMRQICGCRDDMDPNAAIQTLGVEEGALLLATIIYCMRPWWINIISEGGQASRLSLKISSDEESLAEDLWVMARSHRSLYELQHSQKRASSGSTNANKLPSCQEFARCYLDIKRHCLIRVSPPVHPLVSYAKRTIIAPHAMTEDERGLAMGILSPSWLPQMETMAASGNTKNNNGSTIALWRNSAHFAHWLSSQSAQMSDGEAESTRVKAHFQSSYFVYSPRAFRNLGHSCSPSLALTIRDDEDGQCAPLNRLAWLVLHDGATTTISKLDVLDQDARSRSIELKRFFGRDFQCGCLRCNYELSSNPVKCTEEGAGTHTDGTLHLSRVQVKSLADLAMQHQRFEDASKLYDIILQTYPRDGDVLHAKAASYLGRASSLAFADDGHCQSHFIKAQRLWEEAGGIEQCASHPEIATQVNKQRVYKTLQSNYPGIEDKDQDTSISYTSHLGGKCFVTGDRTPIISLVECRNVISAAESYAEKGKEGNGGWTTSRHYAVPTTDIPLHELTGLHSWFYHLWDGTIRPLLRRQFQLTPRSNAKSSIAYSRDIFLHDAFVVRYDAHLQRYLPPHYDESTHSFILALNSGFKGGGTYIHSLGKTLTPATGGMMSFTGGDLLHSGDPVVSGVRYIIAAFCYVDFVGGSAEAIKNDAFADAQRSSKLTKLFAEDDSKQDNSSNTNGSFSFGFSFT